MYEIARTNALFNDWPENVVSGQCDILFHRISDAPEIIHLWTKGSFKANIGLRIALQVMPDVPDGVYRIPGILFYRPNENRFFKAAINPYDLSMCDFVKRDGDWFAASDEEVLLATKRWEFVVSIGDGKDMGDILHCEAHFICSDCLITHPVRVGPVELYPLDRAGVIDVSSSLKEALLFQGIRHVDFDVISGTIMQQDDKRSPLFAMSFHRILRNDKEVVLPLLPVIKRVFGILCLNRGAYSKILGCVYLKRRKGITDVIYANLNSYYRGNLAGGSISREIPKSWNMQYEKTVDDVFKTEVMNKLNSAHAETDLDMAYFRLWSILESVSVAVFNCKKLPSIRKLCKQAYSPKDVEQVAKLSLGNYEFCFNDLLNMWLDWRNSAAHNGGIYAVYAGIRKAHSYNVKMIEEMRRLNMPIEYGEDRSLLILKDVCTHVVSAFINDHLTPVLHRGGAKRFLTKQSTRGKLTT